MDSSSACNNDVLQGSKDKESMVDSFLVEALQNPRHRLTILRMELGIQKFLSNPSQHLFEFQHFPTSYLRLAAHRVAQHYSLQTGVQETGADGLGSKILVWKTAEGRYPSVLLSEIPAQQSEKARHEPKKIAIKPRPKKIENEENDSGVKKSHVRSVEERMEEYDRARARIFSTSNGFDEDDILPQSSKDGKNVCFRAVEFEGKMISANDPPKCVGLKDSASTYQVAIFRDRAKDRFDPDYDRSYERYSRNLSTNQSKNFCPFGVQSIQSRIFQYDPGYSPLSHIPSSQASVGYLPPPSNAVISHPFYEAGLNQAMDAAAYLQWQSAAMMYAQSYDQLRHTFFQGPCSQQQALSFEYSQGN